MNVRLRYNTEFIAGVYYRDTLTMTEFKVALWLLTNTEDDCEQNIAFDRIRYFIKNTLTNTVFVDSDCVDHIKKLCAANISVTTLPSIPVDQIIGMILFSKFNAITEERLSVIDLEISSDFGENVTYLHGEEQHNWTDETEGWWQDPELSHNHGLTVSRDSKVVSLGKIKTWRDVNLSWPDDTLTSTHSNTVIFGDFGDEK
jgi:hypothetical protein